MQRRFFIWAAIISLFLDQVSKVLVYGAVSPHEPVKVLGNVLRFSLTTNNQGLFGMRYGPPFVYIILPILGIALVAYFAVKCRDRWLLVSYGLILGGAVGNLIDRLRLSGRVIDFIDIGIGGRRWYTFNLADTWVVVGIIMLLGKEFLFPARSAARNGQDSTTEVSSGEAPDRTEPGLHRQERQGFGAAGSSDSAGDASASEPAEDGSKA